MRQFEAEVGLVLTGPALQAAKRQLRTLESDDLASKIVRGAPEILDRVKPIHDAQCTGDHRHQAGQTRLPARTSCLRLSYTLAELVAETARP